MLGIELVFILGHAHASQSLCATTSAPKSLYFLELNNDSTFLFHTTCELFMFSEAPLPKLQAKISAELPYYAN